MEVETGQVHKEECEGFSHSSMFLITVVPLEIKGRDPKTKEIKRIWSNKRPSSTLYCRPVKFLFKQETEELIRQEDKEMKDAIDNLQQSICKIGKNLFISSIT